MKKTYTRTLFIEDLTKATVKVYINDKPKYDEDSKEIDVLTYTGLTSWDIVTGQDAEELEAKGMGDLIDENHEYLVLHFEDGSKATFRNSYVDMFIR